MIAARNNKRKSQIIVVLVLIGVWLFGYIQKERAVRDFSLNRDARVSYSKHAKCRMKCRHIDKEEIKEVLREGTINKRKSQPKEGKISLEDVTRDRQHVRVVFAKKSKNRYHVVTCIDLDEEWPCDCD